MTTHQKRGEIVSAILVSLSRAIASSKSLVTFLVQKIERINSEKLPVREILEMLGFKK